MISIHVVIYVYYNTGRDVHNHVDCEGDNFGTSDVRRSLEIVLAGQKQNPSILDNEAGDWTQ